LAFEEPRIRVIIEPPTSPTTKRANHAGTCRDGGAPRHRQIRDPLRRCHELVVDHVVDAGPAVVEREHRGGARVVDVHEGPDPGAVADDGEPALRISSAYSPETDVCGPYSEP
jgi:hypothetical protein